MGGAEKKFRGNYNANYVPLLASLYFFPPTKKLFVPYKDQIVLLFSGTKRVECMDTNQLARRKILEGIQYPFSITSYGKNLFYTDWRR